MYMLTSNGLRAAITQDSPRSFFGTPAILLKDTCPDYEKGEIEKSKTRAGHLSSDVIQHPRGLLIADLGVGWRNPRASLKGEQALKEWVRTILQALGTNPSTKIRIVGFSDCVGSEKNNAVLRHGRAKRVYELINQVLGTTPQWSALRSRIFFVGAAPADDYVADNSTLEGRAKNRGVLIEHSKEVTFEPEVIQLPDTIERIVKRGLELVRNLDQFGLRISKHQQHRIQCILLKLSKPGTDDRYLTGQGVLDYMNLTYMPDPYYARARQWLLPDFVLKSKQKQTDDFIWRTLIRIDEEIIQGRHTINRYYATHGVATPVRIQQLRAWVEKQQKDVGSIYHCYN